MEFFENSYILSVRMDRYQTNNIVILKRRINSSTISLAKIIYFRPYKT